jgi:tRNA (guanine-N7-)-methyltransferase
VTEAHPPQRRVRSFVRREGRMTAAQRRALEELWPRYGIAPGEESLDLDAVFARRAPRYLEIGFGMGDALAAMAERHPERDYLGIEVHQPGVGALLRALDARGLHNVRVIATDAVEVLQRRVPDSSLDGVYIFFPDPWPKKRHHKRRLVQPPFSALLARKLRAGGQVHLATDWEDYARQMLEVLEATPGLANAAGAGAFAPRPGERPVTKFERRGERLGHQVWDLIFERREQS